MFSNWPEGPRVQVYTVPDSLVSFASFSIKKWLLERRRFVCLDQHLGSLHCVDRHVNLVSGFIFYFINLQIELIFFSFLVLQTIDWYFGIVGKLALGQTTTQLLENLEATPTPTKALKKQNLLSWSATSMFYSLNL